MRLANLPPEGAAAWRRCRRGLPCRPNPTSWCRPWRRSAAGAASVPNAAARHGLADHAALIAELEALRGTHGVRGRAVELRGRAARDQGVTRHDRPDGSHPGRWPSAMPSRDGEVDSVELLDACWRSMDARGRQAERDDLAGPRRRASRRRARRTGAVRQRSWLGPLHGVPLVHKDMYYQAGKLSTCGSTIRTDFAPAFTATVIERLERGRRLSTFGGAEHGGVRAEPDRPQSRISATATIPGTSPYMHRRLILRARAPRSRRGSSTRRWAPTPAAPSACRRRCAA